LPNINLGVIARKLILHTKMEWSRTSSKVITHRDGHRIELKLGSWAEPFDIQPVIKKGTPPMESVKLIREGMAFAALGHKVHTDGT